MLLLDAALLLGGRAELLGLRLLGGAWVAMLDSLAGLRDLAPRLLGGRAEAAASLLAGPRLGALVPGFSAGAAALARRPEPRDLLVGLAAALPGARLLGGRAEPWAVLRSAWRRVELLLAAPLLTASLALAAREDAAGCPLLGGRCVEA